ncbi:hypothetical protein LSH36_66g02029 [Paralvinella palmiformis]|uniref:Uncharacterized protein n=1 Tax=Paralvinella palmiformis TaxID=53620 RepID=A0AAD9NBL3_9ANNE|nr:hypothetical protein LSH36_66g02029 [Paralvinella palmiformis]
MAWILRRIRKITLLVLLLVLFGIYMYASSNSIYSINQVSAVYQPLTTPISTETSKKTHSIKQQLRLLSLSSNVHDGSCFHQIWHCFVTNMSQQWPQLVEGNTALEY